MTTTQLAKTLADMYANAPKGDKVTMIHLFGVRYAPDIAICGDSVTRIVELSKIGTSYVTEVHKGIRLSKYVTAN